LALEALLIAVKTAMSSRPGSLASFVWFCHEENYFTNKEATRIWDVYEFTTKQVGASPLCSTPETNGRW